MHSRFTVPLFAAGLALLLSAGPAAAEGDVPQTGIVVSPPRVEQTVSQSAGQTSARISVANPTSSPEVVDVILRDLVISRDGSYQSLPARTTGYSLASVSSVSASKLELGPAGSAGATGVVELNVNWEAQSQPRYGLVVLQPETPTPPPTTIGQTRVAAKVVPQALVPVILVPAAGGSSNIAPTVHVGLEPDGLAIRQADHTGPLDGLLRFDLPRVADHAPLQAVVTVKNSGDTLARAFTHLSFVSVNPLSWLPSGLKHSWGIQDTSFLEIDAAPAAAMPGQLASSGASTRFSDQGRAFETAPLVGLVRVHASTTMVLAGDSSAPVTQEGWILVLPWKELGAVLIALALGTGARRWLGGRRRARSASATDSQGTAEADLPGIPDPAQHARTPEDAASR